MPRNKKLSFVYVWRFSCAFSVILCGRSESGFVTMSFGILGHPSLRP
jgi:hypothetical protein